MSSLVAIVPCVQAFDPSFQHVDADALMLYMWMIRLWACSAGLFRLSGFTVLVSEF